MSIVNIFKRITQAQGISFVDITHDLSTAYYLSDHVSIMNRGRIIESGPPTAVLDAPKQDYTRNLTEAVPRVTERWAEIAEIEARWRRERAGESAARP